MKITYGRAIRTAFARLLRESQDVIVMGQGLWSPWYVGNSMTDLEKEFGCDRLIDSPVSESGTTGMAIGASLHGLKPIVVHPRMDFMLYAFDPIINQAAKWAHMTDGQAIPDMVIRSVINRGGQQGAQHSQALHSMLAHVPGLRVVMPYSVKDAYALLISASQTRCPVVYIDDRWLYDDEDELDFSDEIQSLCDVVPVIARVGTDVTLIAAGYSVHLCKKGAESLAHFGISAEIIDVRQIAPLDISPIVESVRRTRRMVVVDGGWESCGLSSDIIAKVVERLSVGELLASPSRVCLPSCPAPCADSLERAYYPTTEQVVNTVKSMFVNP